LFGVVNPSGKLPATFARTDADLPLPRVVGMTADNKPIESMSDDKHGAFKLTYPEGVVVGYRWFEIKHKQPLFAFGHGLSYTTFQYSKLKTDSAARAVQFQLHNAGSVAGVEVAQLYVTFPASSGEPFQRLSGWQRVQLAPGESQTVTICVDPAYLSIFDAASDKWKLLPGEYKIAVGTASDAANLKGSLNLQ
jgi:beta-glucosidase